MRAMADDDLVEIDMKPQDSPQREIHTRSRSKRSKNVTPSQKKGSKKSSIHKLDSEDFQQGSTDDEKLSPDKDSKLKATPPSQ